MEKFEVIATNITGVNGRIFYAKEKVNADQLGGLEKANLNLKHGFVKSLDEPKKESKKSK
jgi:hypothetical protein